MADLVHIGFWSGHILRPLCGDDSPSVSMSSDKEPGVFIADCPDCITEYERDRCSICDGNGWLSGGCDCCGPEACGNCFDAERAFEKRKENAGWPPRPQSDDRKEGR